MDATGKIAAGEGLSPAGSSPEFLLDAVRANIQRKIDEINRQAALEMERMESELAAEIEDFRKLQKVKHDEIIEYEGGKIRNLSVIGMKKQRLDGMEAFIRLVTDEASASVKDDERYEKFLHECVTTGLDNVKGESATVLIGQDDIVYSEGIMNRVNAGGYKCKVRIVPDERMKLGGAMVVDDEAEVIYNSTVERIVYRMNSEIRREIVRSLREFGREIV